jgi:hypothetical protein
MMNVRYAIASLPLFTGTRYSAAGSSVTYTRGVQYALWAAGSQVRFEELVDAITSAFSICGCGLLGVLNEKILRPRKNNDTQTASRSGRMAKATSLCTRLRRNILFENICYQAITPDFLSRERERGELRIDWKAMLGDVIYIFL